MTNSRTFFNQIQDQLGSESMNLITEFFITFSRFECCLKESIIFAQGDNNRVEPNWEAFASSVDSAFYQQKNPELDNAVNYLIQNPPRIQIKETNSLSWRARPLEVNTPLSKKLSLHIRDVRNNLFHGGKFNGNYTKDVSRNHRLIKSSLIVLNDWLSINENLLENFLTPIE